MPPSLFHILGTARDEMTHSAFIAWLLKGETRAGQIPFDDAKHPLHLFLKCIGVEEEEMKGIESVETFTEKMLSSLNANCNSAERLDIYVRVKREGKLDLEVFVENKVYSTEINGDKDDGTAQTVSYFEALKHREASKHFVYLTVKGEKAKCDNFVSISYQKLMDEVLAPLQATSQYGERLNEYIAALETPAPEENGGKFDIMAMSASTKEYYKGAYKLDSVNTDDLKEKSNSEKSKLCSACYANSDNDYLEDDIMVQLNGKDLSKYDVIIDDKTTFGCGHKKVAELVVAKIVSIHGKDKAAEILNGIKGKGTTILTDAKMYDEATEHLKYPQRKYAPVCKSGTTDVDYWLLKHWDHSPDHKNGNFDQLLEIVRKEYSNIKIEGGGK